MGNLIVDGSDLAAVLDWELVHVGETYEDLAWFCIRAWRFGAPAGLGAGGLGSIDSFLRAYEEAGGTSVDRVAFHWWLVLATLRWGVICRFQAERHLSGQVRSVELAAIGRRVCETEWDLLDLLDPLDPLDPLDKSSGAAGPPVSPKASGDPLHGRPTAAELVAAVAEFLEGDVRQATSGQVNFHARVAANALRIVERELLDAGDSDVRAALAGLGFADEAGLAAAIRAGELDARPGRRRSCRRCPGCWPEDTGATPVSRRAPRVRQRKGASPMTSATSSETDLDVADRLFTAIVNGDRAAVDRLWSDDIAVWRAGAHRDDNKARALRVIDWFITTTTERRYQILDRQLFDSGSSRGFVQQHILDATGHAGQSISLRVCIVIKVGADGLIHRIDEYFDPAGIAPLLD